MLGGAGAAATAVGGAVVAGLGDVGIAPYRLVGAVAGDWGMLVGVDAEYWLTEPIP